MPFPRLSKGVHCRFGYAGIIAEAHFDGSRNIVVELGGPPSSTGHANSGRRRYVMAKPSECANTYLLPKGHPSGRHSAIDWSRPVDLQKFPLWSQMRGFEVILEPGDALTSRRSGSTTSCRWARISRQRAERPLRGVAEDVSVWLSGFCARLRYPRVRHDSKNKDMAEAPYAALTRPPRRRSGGPPAPARCLRARRQSSSFCGASES